VHTFTLVEGSYDQDNALFEIYDGELFAKASLDYESKRDHQIRIRATDAEGLFKEKGFRLSVVNGPDAPTGLILNPSSIAENLEKNAIVGTLTAVDADSDERHTFALVDPSDSSLTDNASFSVSGNVLKSRQVLDFENKNSYRINIRVTDADKLTFERSLQIDVKDTNDAPIGLQLDKDNLQENLPPATLVASITAIDPDAVDQHEYYIAGGEHATYFLIEESQLVTKKPADYETTPQLEVIIGARDSGRSTVEIAFTLTVNDGNDAPVDIFLSQNEVNETSPIGHEIGVLSTIDPDLADVHSYAVLAMDGDPTGSESVFVIDGNLLKVGDPEKLDYESSRKHQLVIQSRDQDGQVTEKEFEISISDGPEAPTDILLTSSSVPENSPVKTNVGDLLTIDPDGEKPLVEMATDDDTLDNEKFYVYRGQLKTNESFNHEETPSFLVRLTAVDETGLRIEKDFTIEVSDIPEPPEGITLGDSTIDENLPAGSIVGKLAAQDPDATDEFEFNFIKGDGDAHNSLFSIDGDELKTEASFDYEDKALYSVRVAVIDST
ncbi:MAG: cadherin domain-containing protein, partial [Opitutae bacterium]